MKKILIVEDDAVITRIYERQFVLAGYEVALAGDGEKAIEMLKGVTPDLVMLDLQMPKANGVEVLKFIRSNPATKDVPVVVFTNSYLSNLVQQAWQAGANKCLTKAICTPRQLIEVVRTTLAEAEKGPVPVPPVGKLVPSIKDEAEEEKFQKEISATFIASGQHVISMLRARLQGLMKVEADPGATIFQTERLKILDEMYQVAHGLAGKAGLAGSARIGTIAGALEALLREMHEKPKNINASTLRTVANAIDVASQLFAAGTREDPLVLHKVNVLVVDDEPISRKTVMAGLEKAGLNATGIEDPVQALATLEKQSFDLVFLDVQMPNMTGHELCVKLRAFPTNAKTPVVFVTAMTDFNNRAKSTLSGGNDLIGKPFLLMELSVKALTYLLKGQLKEAPKA